MYYGHNDQAIIVSNKYKDQVREIIKQYTPPCDEFDSDKKLNLMEKSKLGHTIFNFTTYYEVADITVHKIITLHIPFKYFIWEAEGMCYGVYKFKEGKVTFASHLQNEIYSTLTWRLRRMCNYEVPRSLNKIANITKIDLDYLIKCMSLPTIYETKPIKEIGDVHKLITHRPIPEEILKEIEEPF